MPTIPLYGDRKVQENQLPGVRLTAAETPESEGAGVALAKAQGDQQIGALGGEIAQVAGTKAGQLYQQARDAADTTAILAASNQLSAWENQRLYDPAAGAFTQKGKSALTLPEDVGNEYQDKADEIAGGLSTDRQREAFAKLRAERQQSLDLTLRRYTSGQMEDYQKGEVSAAVDNATNAAISNATDPNRVGEELTRAEAAIRSTADTFGYGPEEVQKQLDAMHNQVFSGVINQMLAVDNAPAARAYFDEGKQAGAITGDAIGRIQSALEAGELRGQAQKQADAIYSGGGTLAQQLDKAKAIDDPKLRDEVQTRLEHQAALDETATRQTEETTLKSAYDVVEKTGTTDKIDPATWSQFTGPTRANLRAYAASLAKGEKIETNWSVFYSLVDNAGRNPAEFANRNMLQYRNQLDDAAFKQMADLQLSIRNGDRAKADAVLGGYRTTEGIVNDTLTQYGLDPAAKPTSDQGQANSQLRRLVDERIETAEQASGKKLGNDDKQAIVDSVLSVKSGSPGSWWGLLKIPTLGAAGYLGAPNLFSSEKRVTDLTIADVPNDEKDKIGAALKSHGRPVSDETILNLYQDALIRSQLTKAGGGGR